MTTRQPSLVPRPHSLTRRNGLVNHTQIEIKNFTVVREVLHNNYQSRNLIGPQQQQIMSTCSCAFHVTIFSNGSTGFKFTELHALILAACSYVLWQAQSVLKIGSAWDEGRWVGVTRRVTVHDGCCSWLQKSPGQCQVGHSSAFLHKRAQKTLLSPCRGSISDILGSFQSRGALSGLRALTIEHLLMSGCGQGHELVKDMWKWFKFPGLTRSRNGNTGEKRGDQPKRDPQKIQFSKQNNIKWLKSHNTRK